VKVETTSLFPESASGAHPSPPGAAATGEFVTIIEDAGPQPPAGAQGAPPWKVLIVDDEVEVHHATVFALADLCVDGRAIGFLHAYSGRDARALLAEHPDVAVVLLDVVMETEDAGLRLVRHVRETLGMRATRIVLRTGQPGYAPEMQVIQAYDINDYRTKAELTRTRLATTITTAIRSFEQVHTIEAARVGIEELLDAGAELFGVRTLESFCEMVLARIATLLGGGPDGAVFVSPPDSAPGLGERGMVAIVANAGCAALLGRALEDVEDRVLVSMVRRCALTGDRIDADGRTALRLRGHAGHDAVVIVGRAGPLSAVQARMVALFCANASVGLENVLLFQRLHASAYFDALTGLPNRARFIDLIDERIARGRPGWVVAIVDVDHFAEANDGLGHENGDRLLDSIGARLRGALDPAVTVARVSGDAFGLFGTEQALDPARVLSLFSRPFQVDGYELQVSASLGLVRLGETVGTGLDALKNANLGLRHAKGHARGRFHWYTPAMDAQTRERVRIAHELRHAIESRELSLYYQPQIHLATGHVVGAEALLRWTTRDGRSIPPDKFIPVAEYSGLIRPIGEWVLRSACRQLSEWNARGLADFRVAVNVSMDQFRAEGFPELVESVVREFGVRPADIELEITESMAMEEVAFIVETLRRLKEIGVAVAIDDFGTGFSSLGHLQRMSVDRLKIDRRFVGELTDLGGRSSIPEMIVKLGHSLGLTVIAEGVETEQHAQALLALGCDECQGYLYARPADVQSFEHWLARRGRLA